MSLFITCDRCRLEINEQGALLFGPPFNGTSVKYHICTKCYTDMVSQFFTSNNNQPCLMPNDQPLKG